MEISGLLEYGLQRGLIAPEDKAYAANRMLALLGLREFEPQPVEEELHTPVEPLERLCQFAAEAGLRPNTRDGRDQFDTELMNCLMPRPSQVVQESPPSTRRTSRPPPTTTTSWPALPTSSRVDRIEKDRMWTAPTPYGDLVITINLSKPEKDPKAIAAAKAAPQSGYPKCQLCRENEGYAGRLQPPRPAEPPDHPHDASTGSTGSSSTSPLRLLQRALHRSQQPAHPHEDRPRPPSASCWTLSGSSPTTLWAPTRICPSWAAPS